MRNKYKRHFLFLTVSVLFIQCNLSKNSFKENRANIVGVYVNKIKANHFKENLELFKDSSFLLTTQYEWSKYEYKGIWLLKIDTLVLKCDTNITVTNEKYFKPKWLLKEKPTELILLSNQQYSLKKSS